MYSYKIHVFVVLFSLFISLLLIVVFFDIFLYHLFTILTVYCLILFAKRTEIS